MDIAQRFYDKMKVDRERAEERRERVWSSPNPGLSLLISEKPYFVTRPENMPNGKFSKVERSCEFAADGKSYTKYILLATSWGDRVTSKVTRKSNGQRVKSVILEESSVGRAGDFCSRNTWRTEETFYSNDNPVTSHSQTGLLPNDRPLYQRTVTYDQNGKVTQRIHCRYPEMTPP